MFTPILPTHKLLREAVHLIKLSDYDQLLLLGIVIRLHHILDVRVLHHVQPVIFDLHGAKAVIMTLFSGKKLAFCCQSDHGELTMLVGGSFDFFKVSLIFCYGLSQISQQHP